jgi:8-oxo-dGTP pyrophosphatase MutT (NUDIX family)
MINYKDFVYLRYVLLVNIIAALIPSMTVKGRANDPLLHSTWWTIDEHSAVLAVFLAAMLSSALVFLGTRTGNRPWWIFVGGGIVAGDFPATFYLATAPDNVYVPLPEMYADGTLCGLLAGAVLTLLLRTRKRNAAA